LLPRAALAVITPVGSCGERPVKLDGADSTAGAPAGGEGTVADAGTAAPPSANPAAPATATSRAAQALPPIAPVNIDRRFDRGSVIKTLLNLDLLPHKRTPRAHTHPERQTIPCSRIGLLRLSQ
jgi:hypothetical protein